MTDTNIYGDMATYKWNTVVQYFITTLVKAPNLISPQTVSDKQSPVTCTLTHVCQNLNLCTVYGRRIPFPFSV